MRDQWGRFYTEVRSRRTEVSRRWRNGVSETSCVPKLEFGNEEGASPSRTSGRDFGGGAETSTAMVDRALRRSMAIGRRSPFVWHRPAERPIHRMPARPTRPPLQEQRISHDLVEFFFDPPSPSLRRDRRQPGTEKYANSAYFRLTHIADAICCCPAEMRIPQTWDVLLFGLTGEPVSISQLIGSDFVVYRRRKNVDL